MLKSHGQIRSLHVEYISYYKDDVSGVKNEYLYRVVVAEGPYSLYHASAHGNDRLDWRDDPFQQRAYVTRDHLYNEFPLNRAYFERSLKPEDRLPGSLQVEFFFFATGIWPLTERHAPQSFGRAYMLVDVCREKERYKVRPRQESVNGRRCHVLEDPGRDLLWVDASIGGALIARETFNPEGGALMQRIDLLGHREVTPGVWLPSSIRNMQYESAAPIEGRRRVLTDALFTILKAEVNKVDPSLFEFRPPPGSLLLKPDNSFKQSTPGGLDLLDCQVRWAKKYYPDSGRVASSPLRTTKLVLIVLLLILIIAWPSKSRVDTPSRPAGEFSGV
jgi:hypothetical protein